MFSGFPDLFAKKESTPFSRHPQLSRLMPIIEAIQRKVTSIQAKAIEQGPYSTAAEKYRLMKGWSEAIAGQVNRYNHGSASAAADEKSELIAIMKELHRITWDLLIDHGNTLAIERNSQRQLANQAINLSCYAAVFAGAAMLPFASIVTVISLFYVGPEVSQRARETLNTSQPYPYSYMLLHQFMSAVCEIGMELNPSVFQQLRPESASPPNTDDPMGYLAILCLRADTPEPIFVEMLKKHYHLLSLIYHPDKRPDKDGSHFVKLNAAYEFLLDENNRKRYCHGRQRNPGPR